jgi:hypothetical protein
MNREQVSIIMARISRWLHDTLLVVGALVAFTYLGGARALGYYFDFSFVPVELTEPVRAFKK